MQVIFEGLDKIITDAKIENAMQKACLVVEAAAREKAPKNTGELRRSIESEVKKEGLDTIVGYIGTPLEFAPYVEYGTGLFAENGDGRTDVPWKYQDDEGNWHTTSGQPPQPFMRPALTENKERVKKIILEGITK